MSPVRINRISLLLLILGCGAAVVVCVTAEPVRLDPLLGDPLLDKRHVHELRVLGGRGNVLAAEFTAWFGDLWRGRQLGVTIAVLTAIATLAFRFIAARPDIYSAAPDEAGRPPS